MGEEPPDRLLESFLHDRAGCELETDAHVAVGTINVEKEELAVARLSPGCRG